MEQERFSGVFRCAVAGVLGVFLLVLAVLNTALVVPELKAWANGESSFPEMTDKLSSAYLTDGFRGKIRLLELNGLAARLSGRRAYNEVVLLKNGMLTREVTAFFKTKDHQRLAKELTAFSAWLESRGTPFLYVQAPCKGDLEGTLLPDGLRDYPNECADRLLEALKEETIWSLDLRQSLAQDRQKIEAYFYRTDHHWSPDGALEAFGILMQTLREGWDPSLDAAYTDKALWERQEKANWFLGSYGKRVGKLFAGTDPLIWYTPRFETEMSCEIPEENTVFEGDFLEANIRQMYIDDRKYYTGSAFNVYIGGDYPLVRHRNPSAPNQKKLLILKDSFVLPLQAFLSTEFSEIDVIDLRLYHEKSIVEYCRETEPELVFMLINVNSIPHKVFADLGV